MQKFVYPEDYLKIKGNKKYCWEIHKEKMKRMWKPYVPYNAFCTRLGRWWWDLNTAINTPHYLNKLNRFQKLYIKLRTLYFRFIYLFKNDNNRCRGMTGSKRH